MFMIREWQFLERIIHDTITSNGLQGAGDCRQSFIADPKADLRHSTTMRARCDMLVAVNAMLMMRDSGQQICCLPLQ